MRGSSGGSSGRLVRRVLQLSFGLVLYGVSLALMVRAGLGLGPWDVFHQGVAEHTGLSIGTVVIITGAAVLLLWIPLRERPGPGTVANVFVVGLAMDGALALLPEPRAMAVRVPLLAVAVVLNGVATGLYIAARFGPGPRDGLMTGLHRVTGRSVRLVRTGIEVVMLVTGFLLGGTAGAGTVVYALAIGPLAQLFLRLFAVPVPEVPLPESPESPESSESSESSGPPGTGPAAEAGTGTGAPDRPGECRDGQAILRP
ncbi:hypothetical protein CUT44_26320 [Streptomyces carminius]|uniref:Membrane protein YczE n=1 Tax=Streptomyces carminius TaxID=2665496 RepID=A0A2M8LT99_9ACTN|nr:hypothetical protein [Streptomyces carminius]PJE95149.1 hypothetical protein CUT44_26320 [Streptomyces carminius]